jgi:hypothetical protein
METFVSLLTFVALIATIVHFLGQTPGLKPTPIPIKRKPHRAHETTSGRSRR